MNEVEQAKSLLAQYLQFQHPELLGQVIGPNQAIYLAEAIDGLIYARLTAYRLNTNPHD